MSHWNNRIFKRDYNGKTFYEIHEVFYNDDKKILWWSTEPEFGPFETIEDLIGTIETLQEDAIRSKDDVLDFGSNPEADWDDEEIDCKVGEKNYEITDLEGDGKK